MTYTADIVFPLEEVYSFAKQIGGSFSPLIFAIKDWRDFPEALLSYGAFSQARRALCYLALRQHQRWEQFVSECWPTANTPAARTIITELERDFINNDLLKRYIHTLPQPARSLLDPLEPPSAVCRILRILIASAKAFWRGLTGLLRWLRENVEKVVIPVIIAVLTAAILAWLGLNK